MVNKQPNPNLQLSREEMRNLGYQIIDMIVDHFDDLPEKSVISKISKSSLENSLWDALPETGENIQTVLEQLQHTVFSQSLHHDHPRFMAFVPSPNNFISAMADALVSGFNIFMGASLGSPGAVTIELVTIDWLRQLCGLPETAGGLFVSGGSIANLLALATARHVKLNDQFHDAIVYFSDQTHTVIDRGLRILGFQAHQLRKLPSDENFCLDIDTLYQAVTEDKINGKIPFCVVANAGTTNTGAVDNLSLLADFCREQGLWLHADGAYGASAILSGQGKTLLRGIEKVDSLAIDPHKWLFQPYEMGCILVRSREYLKDTFSMTAEYTHDVDKEKNTVNFKDYGLQLSRNFRALKLWFSFKVFGLSSFRQAIEKGVSAAEYAEKLLSQEANWEIVTPAQMGILTFRYAPNNFTPTSLDILNQKIVDRMLADGFAAVSTTILRGKKVIRMCPIHPRLTAIELEQTINKLIKFGSELIAEFENLD